MDDIAIFNRADDGSLVYAGVRPRMAHDKKGHVTFDGRDYEPRPGDPNVYDEVASPRVRREDDGD